MSIDESVNVVHTMPEKVLARIFTSGAAESVERIFSWRSMNWIPSWIVGDMECEIIEIP